MAIELNHVFELYVPTQCICKRPLDDTLRENVVVDVKKKFASWFGGFSELKINGGWILPDGTLASEPVDVIKSYTDDDGHDDYIDEVKKLAVSVADRLSQDMVFVTVDGKSFLFPRSKPDAEGCCHGTVVPPKPIVVAPLHQYQSVYSLLTQFKHLVDARNLFCSILNFKMTAQHLPWGSWKESTRQFLKELPEVIADTNGFKIVYLHLTADTLKRGAERQVIQAIYLNDPTFRGLFVVSNQAQDCWELINVKSQTDTSRSLTLRRMRIGTSAVRTATERIIKLHISEAEEKSITANEIQGRFDEAFDVTALTKQFFREISNWYFWAKDEVNFPPGQERAEPSVIQATCVIRLITRLIFIWFLKEKRVDGHTLIPEMLFNKKTLSEILKGFDPEGSGKKQPSHYYKAILQNLFFATLNQPMKNRRWRKEGKDEDKNVYRYQALFAQPDEAMTLFKDIPFLNGGLFECLEQDQFSDLSDVALKVPDYLFFSTNREIDLNKVYGTKNKKYSVSGIIDILERYNFTVEENTPLEEEIALDPELLGKVFENLLASFNPETGETARKQTGSFYTPREIVNYMVDESLKAYLLQKLMDAPVTYIPVASTQADMFGNKVKKGQLGLMEEHQGQRDEKGYGDKLNKLLSYDDYDENPFGAEETSILIDALHSLKVLDPACGSGAFPMGILHKMTHVLKKLDPGNRLWKERQLRSVEDPAMREHIERTFDSNDMDFGRKLYLIQRCIYGVDIQPIAVQISKLRFFISLIVDQQIHKDQENLGILPLPNMETKFVAANTLIGLEKPQQLLLQDPAIKQKEHELERVRKDYFNANNQIAKQKCMLEDERLRKEVGELLKKDHWPATTANKIAGWNPYDLTASSDFFDPEWMFGVNYGFDICIGNPPYGVSFSGSEKCVLKERYTYSIKGKYESYRIFMECGLNVLNNNGILTFVIPNTWMYLEQAEPLRQYLLNNTGIGIIISFPQKAFDASVDSIAAVFYRGIKVNNVKIIEVPLDSNICNIKDYFDNIYEIPVIDWKTSEKCLMTYGQKSCDADLIRNIYNKSKLLGEYIYTKQGLIPYLTKSEGNDNKYISNNKHDNTWKNYLDGSRYVSRYGIKECKSFIKYGDWLYAPRERRIFIEERIIFQLIRNISLKRRIVATYLDYELYSDRNTGLIFKKNENIDLLFILGVLNSKLINYIHSRKHNSTYISFPSIESLPIIYPSNNREVINNISSLVKQIIYLKQNDIAVDTSEIEQRIDDIVFRLYGLSDADINVVEAS